ncbi:MAG: hypothetical protein JWQ07_3453 [Ramlibacter sp.]|nr:hypothetical protein [Ramlibacter sp.]
MDDSAFIDNYRFLAQYNRWFNQRLYAACEQLSDEDRKRERGAFFGSIHNTLNHLIWGDQLWLKRFAAQGVDFPSLSPDVLDLPDGAMHGTVTYENWAALRAKREQLDAAIEDWARAMPPGYPLQTMRYANTKGVVREHPTWKGLSQFFNHQTHHRGQVTTLLAQAGIDPGVTDLIALA